MAFDIGPLQSNGYDIGPLQHASSGTQTISPSAKIPTGESWPTPAISGGGSETIVPAAKIPTGESWGHPTVSGGSFLQTITPSAKIPTGEHWFTADLGGQPIDLGAPIPSGEHWNSPTIVGNPQFINLGASIRSGESWGVPVVQGGNPSLRLFICGVDRTSVVNGLSDFSPQGAGSNASAAQITSQAIGRATLTFDITNLNSVTYTPQVGQSVRVVEGGYTLFAGCLDSVTADLEIGSGGLALVYHCSALDKSSICDHRVVKQVTYSQGEAVQDVILDIVQNYLNGEGITTQGVPPTLGFLNSDLPFNYDTVTDAFNQIATLSGTVWWVNFQGVLNFSPFSTLPPAPWGINLSPVTATGNDVRSLLAAQTLSGSVPLGSGGTTGYRNVQYAVSNLNILPGAGGGSSTPGIEQIFTWTNGQPGIVSQYVMGVLQPVGVFTALALGNILSMTVNGFEQTVVNYADYAGQTSTGPNDFLWFYTSNQSGTLGAQANTATPTFGPVPVNDTIVVVYTPGGTTNSAAVATNPPLSSSCGCGSGIYENVLQVQNINNQADLNAIAAAELAKAGGIPLVFTFETDKPGLFVGMGIEVYIPTMGIFTASPEGPQQLLITQIQGTAQSGPLAYGSWFRWQVTCVSNHDPGNWITFFENLIQQTQNPLPVLQQDIYTFVIGPGANIGSGTVSTNPVYIKRTGLVIQIYAGAADPPQDQDMVLTLTDITQNVVIGQVTIPAGSGAQASVQIASASQIYVFTQDQITVTVTYNQTGPSPLPAQSVTACLVCAM